MNYSVKTSASSFSDAVKMFPEMILGLGTGVLFKPMPAPKIDLTKLNTSVHSEVSGKKPGPKM